MNVKITALPQIRADIYEGEKRIYPGGEALNFAVHCSEFTGIDITLLGAVGNDDYGKKILDTVGCKRIDSSDIRVDKKLPTSYNQAYITPEGDVCNRADSLHADLIDAFKLGKKDKNALMISDVVYITRYSSCFDEILQLRDEYGFKLAADLGVCTDMADIGSLSDRLDFVFVRADEATLGELKTIADKSDCMFNVILDDFSSITWYKGAEYRAEAVPPDETVDMTGCTDSYHAAFVCTYMKDHDIDKAMKNAAELFSITMEHLGGF